MFNFHVNFVLDFIAFSRYGDDAVRRRCR